MFNNKKGNETDFCESYKSEILGTTATKKQSSFFSTLLKLLTILILLGMIIAISIYGYNYFINSKKNENTILPPISVQISDDDLVVELEEEKEELVKPLVEQTEINESKAPLNEEKDIDQIANDVKIDIAKSESIEKNQTQKSVEEKTVLKKETEDIEPKVEVENLEVPTVVPEAKYLEELADLSKEIDKERKK
ncbi:MAG: Unknown protein [uncultured Sulfurovum sp.]|uniref:Uncharacterized protein n=1 Tax=uncultured Sulfurovum sp. TaxID=269237 RepID=A0A6S6SJA5_9BACT|nr:MAG: Unknown protein [uncultured Sulfurovum sp.]